MTPETAIRWHRKGFKAIYWTRKSRRKKRGRSAVAPEVRRLIRAMSRANSLWGAPRIHGELLRLGIEISETSVSKYMARDGTPPSQAWRTFLENHIRELVSIDFLTVPTLSFRVLFVSVVLSHNRRRVVHFNVTDSPTAKWTSLQIVQAFPWDTTPRYLLRDRDCTYGQEFVGRVRSMGIEEVKIAPRSGESQQHFPEEAPDSFCGELHLLNWMVISMGLLLGSLTIAGLSALGAAETLFFPHLAVSLILSARG